MMGRMKQEFLDENGFSEKGWSLTSSEILVCPHGNLLEDDCDGHGDCGCVSPLLQAGII